MPDDAGPIWSAATVPLEGSAGHRLGVSRHRLRAAAYRIAADCELMLEELARPERRLWRDAVGAALVAGRQLLALATGFEAGGEASEAGRQYAELRAQILEPQRRIVESMNSLLGFVPTGADEEMLMQDARTVRDLALGLGHVDAAEPSGPAAHRAALPATQAPVDDARRKPRLLIADDDSASRQALRRLLGRLGYDVVDVPDGRAALDAIEAHPPDLILTDLTMPEVDGFELLRRVKASERGRDIPVIVVSGMDDISSVVRCIEQGAEDHVTKPYEAVLLQARIRASLERKRMRDLELAYLGRVAQLSAAAEAVEREAYQPGSLDAVASREDELGRLARVFDRMISGLRSREERLQRQLGQLRREMQEAQAGRGGGAAPISGDSPFTSGQVVAGRYEILGELGKGGMGMVYYARDRELGEEIALKVVRRDLVTQDPTIVERLKSEIRLARRISHRNVVRAHDLGEWEGVYFLTMEYVRGITVEDLLNTRGALTVESTLAIGSQLADALAVAHEQKIIHRDIKPANLLIDGEGRLRVMDFGLARVAEREGRFTMSGFVVGTPAYMAPERLLGGDADARSDLFSVGVVLYECLTGKPPFDASDPMLVVDQVLEGRPPDLRSVAPHVPRALVALVERLMRPEPDDRIASARELAEQLTQVGQARP